MSHFAYAPKHINNLCHKALFSPLWPHTCSILCSDVRGNVYREETVLNFSWKLGRAERHVTYLWERSKSIFFKKRVSERNENKSCTSSKIKRSVGDIFMCWLVSSLLAFNSGMPHPSQACCKEVPTIFTCRSGHRKSPAQYYSGLLGLSKLKQSQKFYLWKLFIGGSPWLR